MQRYRVMLLFLFLFWAVLRADAQSCTPAGVCTGSWICGRDYDLIVDGAFGAGCSQWNFWSYPATYRETSGTMSCGFGAPFGKVVGPNSDWTYIWQDVQTITSGLAAGNYYSFRWTVELNDPTNNQNNIAAIWIEDLNTGQWTYVDQVQGGHWCETRGASLGQHPEWFGHLLRVQIDTRLATSTTFTFKYVSFWQSSY